ncbi:MAG: Fic family protein [Oculatellaceae cyanobacterium bins.114]|nr:Fic family protein [Oculatellaceae cyanobacterium bins.114]
MILRKIHPEEAGRYRTLDGQAAGTGYVYPPHDLLSELMAEFISWLNFADTQALHPVLYAAEAHHQLVTIHPFRDGNGQAGRLLMNLLLLRAGYPIAIISNENRQRYIEALIQGQQSDNWEPFYTLIIDATQAALVEVLGVLATAAEVQNKALPFYQEMLDFLRQ